jgi:hypothetical protein
MQGDFDFIKKNLVRGIFVHHSIQWRAKIVRGDLIFTCGLDTTADYYHRESGSIMGSLSLVGDSERIDNHKKGESVKLGQKDCHLSRWQGDLFSV